MAINAGDIAFVGVNATDPDQFAILALNAIAAGDSFYVTDGGITRLFLAHYQLTFALPRSDTLPERHR
jgi:hypothetical protein